MYEDLSPAVIQNDEAEPLRNHYGEEKPHRGQLIAERDDVGDKVGRKSRLTPLKAKQGALPAGLQPAPLALRIASGAQANNFDRHPEAAIEAHASKSSHITGAVTASIPKRNRPS